VMLSYWKAAKVFTPTSTSLLQVGIGNVLLSLGRAGLG
jgi:hypothetical protein